MAPERYYEGGISREGELNGMTTILNGDDKTERERCWSRAKAVERASTGWNVELWSEICGVGEWVVYGGILGGVINGVARTNLDNRLGREYVIVCLKVCVGSIGEIWEFGERLLREREAEGVVGQSDGKKRDGRAGEKLILDLLHRLGKRHFFVYSSVVAFHVMSHDHN
ncbi:hypothetical protein Tco_0206885 [Tanacetum coccineum]